MSLQIWLPLNGSLENKGLCDFTPTITTTPTYATDGKIGKAMATGSISMPATATAQVLNNQEFSFSVWVYVNTDTGDTTNRSMFFGNDASRQFSIFQYPTCNDLHLYWRNSGTTTVYLGLIKSGVLPSYQWTHIAVTYKNPTAKIYINGKLIHTQDGTCTDTDFSKKTILFHNAANNCRYLNDYRIYNHCLSAKEVKEISKGLILHYPLNNNGLGIINPNLLVNSVPYNGLASWGTAGSGWSIKLIDSDFSPSGKVVRATFSGTTGAVGGTHHPNKNMSTDIENGEVYTLSAFIRSSSPMTVNFRSEMMDSNNIQTTTEWKYYSVSKTVDTSKTYKSNIFYAANASQVSNGTWIEVCMVKLEKGDKATMWVPHEDDNEYSLYSSLMTKISDCSGYQNNGIANTAPTYVSDSPRYNGSMGFNGSSTYINAGTGAKVKDVITVNIWAYMDDWSSFTNMSLVSCTEDGGWNFKNGGESQPFSFACGYGTTSNTYLYANMDKSQLSALTSGWHMFTGTFDGKNTKLYIDGVLRATSSTLSTKTPIYYNVTNSILVGAEVVGGSTPDYYGNYFKGNLSDLKIFATALSADDIKELYQVSISVDNQGNCFAKEYVEEYA